MASRKKITEFHGSSRRDFIKYTAALGAWFGLERWRVLEAVGDIGGPALADAAACSITNRSVHVFGGSAGFCWFTLLWPQIYAAQNKAKNNKLAFYEPQAGMFPGTDRPLAYGSVTPWKNLAPDHQVSAFMAGDNEFGGTHNDAPNNQLFVDGNKSSLFSACATLQLANPTLVPVIVVDVPNGLNKVTLGQLPYAPAVQGAPAPVRVQSGLAMANLFDSAASAAMGPLSTPANASYFEAYYKAFLGLQATANRPTYARGYSVGKAASRIIGINLSSQLKPINDDYMRYGIDKGTPSKLREFGETLMVTAKAFKLGLTSCVMMPAFNDDYHKAFIDPGEPMKTIKVISTILDGFLGDLRVPDPSCAGTRISDNLVMTFHSDTPKNPIDATPDWIDATPGKCNWIYALGAGWLRTGWYGGVTIENGASVVTTFDPANGKDIRNAPGAASNTTTAAAIPTAGAIAYAVAKGDMRRVGDVYKGGDFSGIVIPKIQ